MADAAYWALTDPLPSSSAAAFPMYPCPSATLIPPEFVLPPLNRHISSAPPAPASRPSADPIPIIDLSLYDNNSASLQLHRASADWGVFQIVNHGVPDGVLQQMRTQIELFLSLPVAERCPRPLGNLGEGYGTGFVRRSTGVTEWRDCVRLHTFPLSRRTYNAWPVSPQFRQAIEDYADEMRALQLRLLGLLSQSLGLTAHRLQDTVGEMQQTLLINHYPPCPQPELAAGVDQHTDIGAITCLWQQDEVVGLQVFHEGAWIPVEPVHGALIVLVGDQVQIASNGVYKSGLHRAVLNATKRRVSVASFYQLKAEQVVAPITELIDDHHPALYQATCFADHQAAMKG